MVDRRSAVAAFAVGSLLASVTLAVLSPAAAAIPASGAWIFPHAKQADALAQDLDDSFYIADSSDPWLQDSFFADSGPDSANVALDLYNPGSDGLASVQLWLAWDIDDAGLLTSIELSGGDAGDTTYSGDDLTSGGTPALAGGGSMDDHDVYPAFFVSYAIGSLGAGSSNIRTVTLEVTGDFEGGLVIHLDYSAEDANENPVAGPFEGDMNIFENGDSQDCQPGSFEVFQSVSADGVEAGGSAAWLVSVRATQGDLPAEYTLTTTQAWTLTHELLHGTGAAHTVTGESTYATPPPGGWNNTTREVEASALFLPNNRVDLEAEVSWADACDGTSKSASAAELLTVTVEGAPTGDAHSASWWASEVEKTQKGKRGADFTESELELLLQRAALASDVFVYGEWNGTAPMGADDLGWVDIDSLGEALDVLRKKTDESKKVRGAERELLALWLNLASGALNLDTPLEIYEKKNRCRGSGSEFADQTGLRSLPSWADTPAEVLAFLEEQVKDWSDGSGASKADLKLARRLARAVSSEWLVPA